ncbi:hypothetical protein M433DRAFT_192710 [Acidomyces richmondensis BFW]|nr:MAG: hypothetical protein FE78DRAFT_456959 [Acidomyces sp. 'richmondensis']KYG46637.1 hypothetical protein M433DRAFT_192710 [Acidomyces richmondensis BFW]
MSIARAWFTIGFAPSTMRRRFIALQSGSHLTRGKSNVTSMILALCAADTCGSLWICAAFSSYRRVVKRSSKTRIKRYLDEAKEDVIFDVPHPILAPNH